MDNRTARINTSFRIGASGMAWLDEKAAEYHLPRADVLRQALLVARKHEQEVDARLKMVQD